MLVELLRRAFLGEPSPDVRDLERRLGDACVKIDHMQEQMNTLEERNSYMESRVDEFLGVKGYSA